MKPLIKYEKIKEIEPGNPHSLDNITNGILDKLFPPPKVAEEDLTTRKTNCVKIDIDGIFGYRFYAPSYRDDC